MPSKKRRYSIFHKEKRRRKYSYTKTKKAMAFILSVIFSVMLAPFFDRYAPVMVHRIGAVASAVMDAIFPAHEADQTATPPPP